ncbi:MAG: helix-turn-helix transcriptional regulator [Ruminococcus sp.]|nr:helix-turn-helix transcriptional regulator [Candidatus Copronaster equi]
MISEELQKQISENIIKYRKLNDISQVELAQMLEYSNKSVSKWERGLGTPDIFVLYKLSVIFGISVSELIGQDEESKATKELIKKTEKDKKEQRKAKKRAEERAKKQRKKEHKQS